MKFNEIFHLGVVVRDLNKAVKIYTEELGYGPFEFDDGAFFSDKVINGKIKSSDDLHRNMRLLRSRMDADRPCLVIEIDQSAPCDKLEGRWHYGKERLEVALRTSFAGDKDGIHILPTIHSDGRILVLACPLHGVDTDMTVDTMTAMLTTYTADSIAHMKEYFGLELHISGIRVFPALTALCENTDEA